MLTYQEKRNIIKKTSKFDILQWEEIGVFGNSDKYCSTVTLSCNDFKKYKGFIFVNNAKGKKVAYSLTKAELVSYFNLQKSRGISVFRIHWFDPDKETGIRKFIRLMQVEYDMIATYKVL